MITLRVTLDPHQRRAVMAEIHSRFPATATTTQAITDGGLFRIRPLGSHQLPDDLTVDLPMSTPDRAAIWLRSLQQAHEQAPVAPLSRVLPLAVNELVQRCLAKAPAARYTRLADLLGQLTIVYQAHFDQPPPPGPAPGVFTAVDHYNRGVTYYELGQQVAALADYTQALTLDPTYAAAYSNRGAIYTTLGQRDAALADYTQALALDPTYATAYYNRGITYAALGQQEAALADFTQALTLDPTLVQAYYNRGVIYDELGQREAALTDYTQALTLDPTDAQAYSNRGVIYADLGQREAALADYTQALALDPTFAQAYVNIGALLGNEGRLGEALPYLEKAAQLGDPRGAQYAAQVRQVLEPESEAPMEAERQALSAFSEADTLAAMQQAVARFPLLVQADLGVIEEVIAQEAPPEQRPAFEQRLAWLRQIAGG